MSHSSKENPDDVNGEAGKSKSKQEKKDENNDSLQTLPLEGMHITDENERMKNELTQKLESIEKGLQEEDSNKVEEEIGNLSTEMSLDMINKLADDADLMTTICNERSICALVLVWCMQDVYKPMASSPDQLSGEMVRCLYMAYKIIAEDTKSFDKNELANIETILGRMLKLSFDNKIHNAVYKNFLNSIKQLFEKPENSDQGSTKSPTQTPQKVSETQKKVLETERESNPVKYSKTPFLEYLLWQEKAEAFFAKNCLEGARPLLEKLDAFNANKLRLNLMLIETFPHTAKMVNKQMAKLQESVDRFSKNKHPTKEELIELTKYYKEKKKKVQAMAINLCVYHASPKSEFASSAKELIAEMVKSTSKMDAEQGVKLILDDIREKITSKIIQLKGERVERVEMEPTKLENHAYLSLMGLIDCIEGANEEESKEMEAANPEASGTKVPIKKEGSTSRSQ